MTKIETILFDLKSLPEDLKIFDGFEKVKFIGRFIKIEVLYFILPDRQFRYWVLGLTDEKLERAGERFMRKIKIYEHLLKRRN